MLFRSVLYLSLAVIYLIPVKQAFAHAHLVGSTPPANSMVTVPSELVLTFSEELNLKFTGVKLAGPAAASVRLDQPKLMDSDKTLMVPISGTMLTGTYTVNWSALSVDGHKTQGSFKFTVKP